ncbi:MAG: hypothetical protein ACTJG2_01635 [Candidatus Saccharimonadales bacterium]
MRGVSIVNKFRYLASSKTAVAALFVLTLMLTAGIGVYKMGLGQAQAATGDCSSNSIIKCGVSDYNGLTAAYDKNEYGDIRNIMDHYWIKRTPAAGDRVVMGHANNKGEVIADGRVVANNAASIGREPIAHSNPIEIKGKTYYQTTHVGGLAFKDRSSSLKTIVVLDAKGNFKYAIILACGNPIYAKPVPPPKPEPKDIQVCDLESKKIITIKEDEYDQKKHSKNLRDCQEKKLQVCELESKKIITIKESEYDSSKHSKNLKDCESKQIEVCELATKNWMTIDERDYDATKHSKNKADCETPAPTPVEPTPPALVELPKTGAADVLGATFGLSSIALATYYYYLSRRNG